MAASGVRGFQGRIDWNGKRINGEEEKKGKRKGQRESARNSMRMSGQTSLHDKGHHS
jgi:hypothetical protein